MPEKSSAKYVIFKVGNEFYALETTYVRRVDKNLTIRQIPNSPKEFLGIVDVKGEDIAPVMDIRTKLNLTPAASSDRFFIICSLGDRLIGLLVDRVTEVKPILLEEIKPVHQQFFGINSEYISGIYRSTSTKETDTLQAEELIVLLDLHKLLGVESLENIETFFTEQ